MNEREVVTIREYFEALLAEREKQLEARWVERDRWIETRQEASVRTLDKALGELDERIKLLNNLREQVLTRQEYDAKHEVLINRLSAIEQWRSNIMGRAVALALVGTILVAVLSILISHAF